MEKSYLEKEFKEDYPNKVAEGGVIMCEYSKDTKTWGCEVDKGQKFQVKTLRITTTKPNLASSLFVNEYGDLAGGGLTGSKVVCRDFFGKYTSSNTHDEIKCIIGGV